MINAWIQRVLTLSLIALALTATWLWRAQPYYLIVGICLPMGIVALIEFVQFSVQACINKADVKARASFAEYLKAYTGEVMASLQVFGMWQPFQRQGIPDNIKPGVNKRRGIVLVHGFFCNRGLWKPWLQQLHTEGRVFVAVDLEPPFGSIDTYWKSIDDAVQQIWLVTGRAPILIGHSMGGLAIRSWFSRPGSFNQNPQATQTVHRIITLGTPHHGTWLGQFSHAVNGRQMKLSSQWLLDLRLRENTRPRPPITCIYSNCDNIVFPVDSATLEGADNRLVRGLGHVHMLLDKAVMRMCWTLLD